MKAWIQLALRPDIVRRGAKVALVVGTVLTAINQGDVVASGEMTLGITLKILMTFCVPYCVSTYASVTALVQQRNSHNQVSA